MAKCIRFKDGGFIIRVPDKMAADKVSEGKAEYVGKEDWKKEVRDAKKK